jgi:hypothetical protein
VFFLNRIKIENSTNRAVPLVLDRVEDEESNGMICSYFCSSLRAEMIKFFIHYLFCLFSAGAFALRSVDKANGHRVIFYRSVLELIV